MATVSDENTFANEVSSSKKAKKALKKSSNERTPSLKMRESSILEPQLERRPSPESFQKVTETQRLPLRVDTVRAVLKHIEGPLRGFEETGLYRETGLAFEVMRMAREYGAGPSSIDWSRAEPLNAAVALLRYLREVVVPYVVPAELAEEFLAVDTENDVELCAFVMKRLPPVCRQVFFMFFEHLVKVIEAPQTGLANGTTVAVVVASAVCPSSTGNDAITDSIAKQSVVTAYLDKFHQLFSQSDKEEILKNLELHTGLTPERPESKADLNDMIRQATKRIQEANNEHVQSKKSSGFKMKIGKRGKSSSQPSISTPTHVRHRVAEGSKSLVRTKLTKAVLLERVAVLEKNQRKMEAEMAALRKIVEEQLQASSSRV